MCNNPLHFQGPQVFQGMTVSISFCKNMGPRYWGTKYKNSCTHRDHIHGGNKNFQQKTVSRSHASAILFPSSHNPISWTQCPNSQYNMLRYRKTIYYIIITFARSPRTRTVLGLVPNYKTNVEAI